jgi:hypothetical protein
MQALRQLPAFSTPSGPQGHDSPSAAIGMDSAHGRLATFVPADRFVAATTTGADNTTCAATSTKINVRKRRDTTRTTYASDARENSRLDPQ